MLYATLVEAETLSSSTARTHSSTISRLSAAGLVLGVVLVLGACSGGSGADVQQNPGTGSGPVVQNYTGPAPSTADVQSFKINLWDNIRGANRCGTCHSEEHETTDSGHLGRLQSGWLRKTSTSGSTPHSPV